MTSEGLLTPGEVLDGRFEVLEPLAVGAFGALTLAVDRDTGMRVAVKTLHARAAADPEQVARLEREAWICARLRHPGVVAFVARGTVEAEGGQLRPYLAMEIVRGLSLADVVARRGPLPVGEAVPVVLRVLEALEEAHRHGIVHRDLKPQNVLVEAPESSWTEPAGEGSVARRLGVPEPGDPVWDDLSGLAVRLVDFGLGKVLEVGDRRVARLTGLGMAAGTVQYMPPEQVKGSLDLDHRADLYGAAMLLYRLLAGRPAFEGSDMVAVAALQVNEPLPPLPPPLDRHPIAEVLARAAEKRPKDRPPSAGDMAWDLRVALDPSLAGTPRPVFEPPPATRARGLLGRLLGR